VGWSLQGGICRDGRNLHGLGGGVCKGKFAGAGGVAGGGGVEVGVGSFFPPKRYSTGTGHLSLKARADHNSLTKPSFCPLISPYPLIVALFMNPP